MKFLKITAIAAAMLAAPSAYAATLDAPVASNAYISKGGLEWAWAGPCAASSPSCGVIDLSYQGQFGWRLPTLAEFQSAAIEAMDFVFAGANVPQGGTGVNGARFQAGTPPGDAACAAIYFNVTHDHCDWNDGTSGLWDIAVPGIAHEALVVRGNVSPVPVPAGLPLIMTGLAAFGWMRRKAKRA